MRLSAAPVFCPFSFRNLWYSEFAHEPPEIFFIVDWCSVLLQHCTILGVSLHVVDGKNKQCPYGISQKLRDAYSG